MLESSRHCSWVLHEVQMHITRKLTIGGNITITVENDIIVIPLTTKAAVGIDCFGTWDSVKAEYRAGILSAVRLLLAEGYTELYLFVSDGRRYGGNQTASETWRDALLVELNLEVSAGQVAEIYVDNCTSSRAMLPSMLRWMMGHAGDLKEAHMYWFTDLVRKETRAHQTTKAIRKVRFRPSNIRINGLRRPDTSWRSSWWVQLIYSLLPVK